MARGFHLTAITCLRATTGADAAIEPGGVIRPDRYLSSIAARDRVRLNRASGGHVGRQRIPFGAGAKKVAAHQSRTTARVARHIDRTAGRERDVIAQHLDRTALLARSQPRRIQRAAVTDRALLPTAEHDRAVDVFHGTCLDDAGVVDHAGQHGVLRTRGQDHGAAVGLDQAAVFHQIIERALVDLHVDQAVAGERQGHVAASAQCHTARRRTDDAVVADAVADKGDVPAIGRRDTAAIDDAAGAGAAEPARRAIERSIVDVERGCNQAAHVDLRTGAEQHAVRVDQVDLAIGIELAHELGAIGVEDAIDRDRTA